MTRVVQVVVCAALLVCAAQAQAQRRQQVYDFDDTAVEGELVRPDASLVTARPAVSGGEGDIAPLRERVARGAASDAQRLRLAELLAARMNDHRADVFRAMDAAYGARIRGDVDGRARAARLELQATRAAEEDANAALDVLLGIPRTAERALRARALSLEVYLLGVLDRDDAALAAARRLLRVCPSCPEAAEAHLHVAEAAFAGGHLQVALEHYGRVLTVPGVAAQMVAYARYKRGWVHLNLGRLEEAWDDLEAARHAASRLGPSGRNLGREAGQDLVRVMSMQRVDATTALARIDAIAADDEERGQLEARYEQMLRDSGRFTDADDFAGAR